LCRSGILGEGPKNGAINGAKSRQKAQLNVEKTTF